MRTWPPSLRDRQRAGNRHRSRLQVKSAMNDINAAQREQVAANARGEAEKILVVKKAEAEAESKALQGQGIANQRKAIIEVAGLDRAVPEGGGRRLSRDVMQLVLVTQYFDTLKSIGESDKTNTLFLSHFTVLCKGSLRPDSGVDAGGATSEQLDPGWILNPDGRGPSTIVVSDLLTSRHSGSRRRPPDSGPG